MDIYGRLDIYFQFLRGAGHFEPAPVFYGGLLVAQDLY
jgi:hypothetical protein